MKKSDNEWIFRPLERENTLRDRVYETLWEAIVNGHLKPGDKIVERNIAAQLSTSRTPVKEAIRGLEQIGVVSKGVVAEKTPIEEIYMIRATLHGLSARLAAHKVTSEELTNIKKNIRQTEKIIDHACAEELYDVFRDFHILVFIAAKNVLLYRFQANIGYFIREYRFQAIKNRNQAKKGLTAHKKIAQAIEKKDGNKAEDLMRSHILESARFVLGDHVLLEKVHQDGQKGG